MKELDIYISFWGFLDYDKDNLDKRMSSILDMMVVSFSYAKKHYRNVYLVTDSKSLSLFENIPFTKIFTDLDELHELEEKYHRYWSLGKIKTIELATRSNRPFVQIDYDVFLQKPLPNWLTSSRVFAQSTETVSHTYAYNLDLFYEIYGYLGPCVHRSDVAYNCGIIGGTDIEFFKKYSRGVLDFVNHSKNKRAFDIELGNKEAAIESYITFSQYHIIPNKVPNFQFAIWSEQYYLACLSIQEKLKIEVLLKDSSSSDEYIAKQASELGYVHLLDGKNDESLMSIVKENANSLRSNNFKII